MPFFDQDGNPVEIGGGGDVLPEPSLDYEIIYSSEGEWNRGPLEWVLRQFTGTSVPMWGVITYNGENLDWRGLEELIPLILNSLPGWSTSGTLQLQAVDGSLQWVTVP